jgi:acetoin utilization protein AcuB
VLVNQYMKVNPMTVFPTTTCSDAYQLMLQNDIEKLPVISEKGALVGIATKKDLLCALPSSAALLSVSEIDNLFGAIVVASVMSRRVISVSEDCPLEEAARILADNKIGSMPVMRGHRIIGMITKVDVFRAMMAVLGGQAEGLRITVRLHEDTGELGAVTDGIVHLGGKLISLSVFGEGDPSRQMVTLKVQGIDPEELMLLLEKDIGVEVIGYRPIDTEFQPEVVLPSAHTEAFTIPNLDAEFIGFMDSR